MMKICHIAPFNTAGVPLSFVKAERSIGCESRLITLARDPQGRESDICLGLPLIDFRGTKWIKRIVTPVHRRKVDHIAVIPHRIPIQWSPGGMTEHRLIKLREKIWEPRIRDFLHQFDLFAFDVIQLDGGMGFFRDARIMKRLKQAGKKIICCYTGSDLRIRGVIPDIDVISDLNVSVEFDHLRFHPRIHHVPFPMDTSRLNPVVSVRTEPVRIGHAPTNRKAKGSHLIIPIVRKLEKSVSARLILIENLPYERAIARKRTCHIFIDQIGNLGYGINGLESLAMGIPTCSSLAEGFDTQYPDHPFVVVDENNLTEALLMLIKDDKQRQRMGSAGIEWVREIHDPVRSVQRIHRLADLH